MSWSSNHVPKYRKHRASGQAIVTICGRDHYLGPHGTKVSKVEYDRLIAEFLANGRQSLHISPHGITVVELCSRYIDYAKHYYRKKDGSLTTTSGSVVRDLQLLSSLKANDAHVVYFVSHARRRVTRTLGTIGPTFAFDFAT